ncbi:MAG TPA: hypothetical protein ENO17_06435 [Candidatus Atribacteria bacterium]|nr:hypothetical protein [Candidatus Atribacteria bacterium]
MMIKIILKDWPGWLVILLTFFILYKYGQVKKDKKITLAIGLVLLLHHFIAIINTYFFTFPGAEPDPVNFQGLAIEWAEGGKLLFSVGTHFYAQILGIFYRIFAPSQLFGGVLSILAFLLSCFVLIKIIELLSISKYVVPLLLIYGLLPTNLIFCSKILRESYQILFFMLSVYWGLLFNLKSAKGAMTFCVVSALIMGLFQKALILYALFLVPLLFLWFPQEISISQNNKRRFSKRRWITVSLLLILIIGVLIMGIQFKVGGLEAVKGFLSGEWLKYVKEYRIRGIEQSASYARAMYDIRLDTSSAITLIRSICLIFIYYLFAPFPWQCSNWLDIYGAAESLLRFLLITFSIITWYRASGVQRRIWGLLLVIYFSMTFLWAMGTVNYGTSIRHHVLTNWIIIILGGPGLLTFMTRQCKGMLPIGKLFKKEYFRRIFL